MIAHGEPIVVANSLTKVFRSRGRQVEAVRDVSLEVRRGELFGLFGPNGAGKSTLIRMLSTLLTPTQGVATVDGLDLVRDALKVRKTIGLVASDERSFYGRLSARKNLEFYAALQDVSRGQIPERAQHVLDLFGLSHKADAPFQSLSTGQRQRLNMARALVHDPPILFLDEPTKSMDVQTGDFVKGLIKDELVARQGKTVVFISHELYEMDNFCDRVAILADGRLRAVGTPVDLAAQLPRRAIFRIQVEGEPEPVIGRWRDLPGVEDVVELSRGVAITSFDVTLVDEGSGVWFDVLSQVAECGGRVEAYQRVDDRSLREVIRHFSDQAVT
jgi:ABC-2 type transport system ATP-binding protein